MSNPALKWAWASQIESPTAKFVLVALADMMNATTGECFPSVATISKMTGLSERSVRASLKTLEEAGLIKRKFRTTGTGRKTSTEYFLAVKRGAGDAGGRCSSRTYVGASPAPPEPELGTTTVAEATVGPLKRGSRLSEDWSPSPASWARAEKALPQGALEDELTKFRNYWMAKAGKDAVKLDWNRTFDNWIISAKQRTPTHGTRQQEPAHTIRSSLDAVNAAVDAELARYSAAGPRSQYGEHHPDLLP
jgi:DNA-binding transcriptional ArsR family regulator